MLRGLAAEATGWDPLWPKLLEIYRKRARRALLLGQRASPAKSREIGGYPFADSCCCEVVRKRICEARDVPRCSLLPSPVMAVVTAWELHTAALAGTYAKLEIDIDGVAWPVVPVELTSKRLLIAFSGELALWLPSVLCPLGIFASVSSCRVAIADCSRGKMGRSLAWAELGYATQAMFFDSVEFGLPHHRFRVVVVAANIRDPRLMDFTDWDVNDIFRTLRALLLTCHRQPHYTSWYLLLPGDAHIELRRLESPSERAKDKGYDQQKAMKVAENLRIPWGSFPVSNWPDLEQSPWYKAMTIRQQDAMTTQPFGRGTLPGALVKVGFTKEANMATHSCPIRSWSCLSLVKTPDSCSAARAWLCKVSR